MKKISRVLLLLCLLLFVFDIIYDSLPKKIGYYSNGQVSMTSTKKNPFFLEYKIFGEWYEFGDHQGVIIKRYYPNGEIKSRGVRINGVNVGVYKYYFDNGQLKKKGLYNSELKVPRGKWEYYHKTGELNYIIDYQEGLYYFDEGGRHLSKDEYGFYENGQVFMKDTLNSRTYYHKNGKVWRRGVNEDGIFSFGDSEGYFSDGFWEIYYSNGQLKETGEYNIRKEGLWKFYNQKGELSSEVTYSFGEPIFKKCWDEDQNEIECEE